EDIVRVLDRRDPCAQGLVDGVLERARTRLDRDDLGAEKTHTSDRQSLTLGVDLPHVDRALDTERRGGSRRGDAVLTCAGLRNRARLTEALREERLAQHVVDLVTTGVVKVFALQKNARPARVLGEPLHLGERRGASGVF